MGKELDDDRSVPALCHMYIECPHCGRIPKPDGNLLVPADATGSMPMHVRFPCDRCGYEGAMLYMEREIMPVH
jgi:hypothetical protein